MKDKILKSTPIRPFLEFSRRALFKMLKISLLSDQVLGESIAKTSDGHGFVTYFRERSLVTAVPYGGEKKAANSGIDGFIFFKSDGKTAEKAFVFAKGGSNIGVPMIRDLGHVVDRKEAKIRVLITLAEPTKPIQVEATKAGFYETPFGKFPKLQILTFHELFSGNKPHLPWVDAGALKKAELEQTSEQHKLF